MSNSLLIRDTFVQRTKLYNILYNVGGKFLCGGFPTLQDLGVLFCVGFPTLCFLEQKK